MSYYRTHVFLCVNRKDNGKKCCQDAQAADYCQFAKEWVHGQGLAGQGQIRISSSGCLGRCAEGPILVIYPEGVWYTYHSQADVEEILTRHILLGERVERLLLDKNESELA